MDCKILITGVTGYLGSNIFKYLREKNLNVKGLVNEVYSKNYTDDEKQDIIFFKDDKYNLIKELSDSSFSILIHTAGATSKEHNIDSFYFNLNANISFGVRVIESLKIKPNTIIFSNTYSSFMTKEINTPDGFYGASKEAFSSYLKYYSNQYNIRIINCHLYDIYGPNDTRNKVINIYIKAAMQGFPIETSIGLKKINFVYIKDFIAAIYNIITNDINEYKKFNNFCVYGKEVFTLQETRSLIEETLKKRINISRLIPDTGVSDFSPIYPLLPAMKKNFTPLRGGIIEIIKNLDDKYFG